MGKFEVSRFVTVPDPDLICCVCFCVLDDPLESPCQHVFCNVCISTWLNNRKNCPNCRARLQPSRLKPVLPIVRNMINRLQIHCENIEEGCTSVVQLEKYKNHVDTCDFATVLCKNEDCDRLFLRKNLKEHEIECRYRLTKCEKGCDLLFPVSKLTGHNCLSELKVKLQKAEDNLEAVTLKVTNIEKRLQTLEQNERNRPGRSPEYEVNGRSSPPLPWYSPSGPNRIDNERSRHRSRDQTDNGSRRRRGRSSRFSSRHGRRRRRRSRILIASRSRSRSPVNGTLLVSESSSLSVTSDESFNSEIVSETTLSPAENSERSSIDGFGNNNNNNISGAEAPEVNTAAAVASEQPEESGNNRSSFMNISNTSLSEHSSIEEERDSNIRRSPRIAASRGPSNNSRTPDVVDNTPETPYSSVPILSRRTIDELMNASSNSSDESFNDPLPRFSMSSSSNIEIEDDSGDHLSDISTTSRTHWTSLVNGLIYESSDTDDTWSWRNRSNRSQTSDSQHE